MINTKHMTERADAAEVPPLHRQWISGQRPLAATHKFRRIMYLGASVWHDRHWINKQPIWSKSSFSFVRDLHKLVRMINTWQSAETSPTPKMNLRTSGPWPQHINLDELCIWCLLFGMTGAQLMAKAVAQGRVSFFCMHIQKRPFQYFICRIIKKSGNCVH